MLEEEDDVVVHVVVAHVLVVVDDDDEGSAQLPESTDEQVAGVVGDAHLGDESTEHGGVLRVPGIDDGEDDLAPEGEAGRGALVCGDPDAGGSCRVAQAGPLGKKDCFSASAGSADDRQRGRC